LAGGGAVVATLWSVTAAREWGRRERSRRRSRCAPYLGPVWSCGRSSAAAGGGGRGTLGGGATELGEKGLEVVAGVVGFGSGVGVLL